MHSCSQGSARSDDIPQAPSTPPNVQAQSGKGALTAELDAELFGPPFILIDTDNQAVSTTTTLATARQRIDEMADAVAIVGTLRPGVVGVDIDPDDTGAEPQAGQAVSDDLVSWCDRHGLPWYRRASGRPGHIHLITVVPSPLRGEFLNLSRFIGTHHAVSVTARSTLRLLTAAHRHRLPAPTLGGTLTTADLVSLPHARTAQPSSAAPRPRRPRCTRRAPPRHSRSEREFGDALARARAQWSTIDAWNAANTAGSKANELGQHAWRRWFWAPATTIVAAERGLTEDQAWKHFREASPMQADRVGRQRWRAERWLPALEEARRERPRRRRVHRSSRPPDLIGRPARASDLQYCIEAVRVTLLDAASESADARGRLPGGVQFTTLLAALHALVEPIALDHGSIAVRAWAERARLDPKTIRRARDAAEKLGLIRRSHSYRGGPHDSDAWTLTEELQAIADRHLRERSPTPYTPVHGSADPERLLRQHRDERRRWRRQHRTRSSASQSRVGPAGAQPPADQAAVEARRNTRWPGPVDPPRSANDLLAAPLPSTITAHSDHPPAPRQHAPRSTHTPLRLQSTTSVDFSNHSRHSWHIKSTLDSTSRRDVRDAASGCRGGRRCPPRPARPPDNATAGASSIHRGQSP